MGGSAATDCRLEAILGPYGSVLEAILTILRLHGRYLWIPAASLEPSKAILDALIARKTLRPTPWGGVRGWENRSPTGATMVLEETIP